MRPIHTNNTNLYQYIHTNIIYIPIPQMNKNAYQYHKWIKPIHTNTYQYIPMHNQYNINTANTNKKNYMLPVSFWVSDFCSLLWLLWLQALAASPWSGSRTQSFFLVVLYCGWTAWQTRASFHTDSTSIPKMDRTFELFQLYDNPPGAGSSPCVHVRTVPGTLLWTRGVAGRPPSDLPSCAGVQAE